MADGGCEAGAQAVGNGSIGALPFVRAGCAPLETTTGDSGIRKSPPAVPGAFKSCLAGMERLFLLDVPRVERKFLESKRLQQIDVPHYFAVWNAAIGR